MKHKIFSTAKAEILVVDLPEGANRPTYFNDKERPYLSYFIGVDTYREYGLSKGNWQPLTFDEETAKMIVDDCSFYAKCWKKYNVTIPKNVKGDYDPKYSCYTALESLKSLIEANVPLRNNLGLIEPKAYRLTGLLSDIEDNRKWQQAEESVFHNPHYFFKLK